MTTTDGDARLPRLHRVRRRLVAIRFRIVLAYVLLLVIALGVSIVLTRYLMLDRLDDQIDSRLTQEVSELRQLTTEGIDPATGDPFGNDVEAILHTYLDRNVPDDHEAFYTLIDGEPGRSSYNADVRLYQDPEIMGAWTDVSESRWDRFHDTVAGEVRSLAVPLVDGPREATFIITYLPEQDRADVLSLIQLLTIIGTIVLLLTVLVAWSVADRVLLPVRQLTSTAREISDERLSERIPVTGHDELAELGDTFNAMIERLEESFEYQRQFLDDVAHELRTPITIARGHVDLLGDTPTEREEAKEVISDELDRMARYVSDLLTLAKAGRPDFLRMGPLDLGDLAMSVFQRVGAIGPRHWVLDDAPAPGTTAVAADEERLVQAMVNLATNAMQHTHEGDEIGIGVRHLGTTYQLWVRDSGPGIDPELLDHLFDRGTRGATSRSTRHDGLGIGLSIVDAIAVAHGGSMAAANYSASGTPDATGAPGATGATITMTCAADPEARAVTTPQETP